MKRYPYIVICVYIVTSVGCNLTGAAKLEHSRKKHSPGAGGGPGGVNCGRGDLVSRCKIDVDYNILFRMMTLDENSPSFEFVPFDYDTSRSEAVQFCPTGTHFAVIIDAVVLDNAAAKAFGIGRDINYWVDVSLDLDNVSSFLLQSTQCMCFNNDFHIHTDESTFMEVKADRYKIKKKKSMDKKMMRGVICQKDEVTTTKPQAPTPSSKSTSSFGASISQSNTILSHQNPTVSIANTITEMNVGLPTNPASTQKAFDWIIFLLCVIAITLIIGLFVGCVICWRIKSKKHQTHDNHTTVACAIKPYSVAPPAYESPEGIKHPPANPVRKSGIPAEIGVYSGYEIPMENPQASHFQQPAGLYNGSTGYADMGSPSGFENQPGDMYDELQLGTCTSQAEYSYAYADRKTIVDQLHDMPNQRN
ncbi:uncharacterized protein LOC117123388 isoform X2 [Anneissia japonica]|uniref:uncharacterized protein LOC117123388 isoform X2 n=1 Tax=Anneissia japonica TaxID=1529436 RepID=UPI00142550AB|nr:uncharacterized protein LOC117123388 isoform X2 [Anneissia japonica]